MPKTTEEFIVKFSEEGLAELNAKMDKHTKTMLNYKTKLVGAMKNNDKEEVKSLKLKIMSASIAKQRSALEAKGMTDQVRAIGRTRSALIQASLSSLFFGMTLNRTFDALASNSFNTFNKMNQGTELANNATNRLAANLSLLNYELGSSMNDALESVEGPLQWFIDKLTDIVGTDVGGAVAAYGVGLGKLAGEIMEKGGQLGAFITGIKSLKDLGALDKITNFFSALSFTNLLAGIKSFNWALVGTVALWAIAIGMVMVIIGLLTGQEVAVKFVRNIIEGFATAIMWMAFKLRWLVATIGAGFEIMWAHIGTFFKGIFNGIMSWIVNQINKVITWYNNSAVAKLAGKVGTITNVWSDYSATGDLESKLGTIQDKMKSFYDNEDELWKTAQESVKKLGETFEIGMKKITDYTGQTQAGQGWNQISDLFGNSAIVQQQAANQFDDTVNKFSEKVDQMNSGGSSGAGNLSGFSTTLP